MIRGLGSGVLKRRQRQQTLFHLSLADVDENLIFGESRRTGKENHEENLDDVHAHSSTKSIIPENSE
jgi:hypothetical protein